MEPTSSSQHPIVPRSERRLTTTEFEQVIRRAAELQAASAEGAADDAMSEAEVVRIGRELGLTTAHLNRALAEVKGVEPAERGVLARAVGEGRVTAYRTVAGQASEVETRLERYLIDWEYLAVQRRLPDRTVFTRAAGIAAAVGRATSSMTRRQPLLKVPNLEVAVQPLEEGYSHVVVASELSGSRAGFAAGIAAAGGGGAAATAIALGVAVAPAAAVLGLPVLAGTWWGFRAGYRAMLKKTQTELEALLDRLEHDELPGRPGGRGGRGGSSRVIRF